MSAKICFAGGGSGGHLTPLLAMYQEYSSPQNAAFLIPPNEFDLHFCQKRNLPHKVFSGTKFYAGNKFLVLWKLFKACRETEQFYQAEPWDYVISSGGYAAVPVLIHCILKHIPFFQIEPNRIAGKVTKAFAPFAKTTFVHYKDTLNLPKKGQVKALGTPLIFTEKPQGKPECLLVFGASLGARAINEFLSRLIKAKTNLPPVVWITGTKDFEAYQNLASERVQILPFSHDMASLYAKASLMIARSGASTVAEAEFFGIPAIFVPYPHHKDKQQYLNCEHLVQAKSALLWEEDFLNSEASLDSLLELLDSKTSLASMRQKMKALDKSPSRTQILAEIHKILLDPVAGKA